MLQGTLVLGHGEDAELDGKVGAGDHRLHAWHSARRRGVDRQDARMWVGAAQDAAVEGAGGEHVVGVDGAAGHLGDGVGLGEGLADDGEAVAALSCGHRHL